MVLLQVPTVTLIGRSSAIEQGRRGGAGRDGLTTATGTARISGIAVDAVNGLPIAGAQVDVLSGSTSSGRVVGPLAATDTAQTFSEANGAFTFVGVPSGDYTLATAPAGQTPWANLPVAVRGSHVDRLDVHLRPGIRVSGRYAFEAPPMPPTPETSGGRFGGDPYALARGVTAGRLGALVPTGYAGPPGVRPDPAGRFETLPHAPGRYLLLEQRVPGWQMERAMLDGRDISRVPVELADVDLSGLVVTFVRQRVQLSGTVTPPAGVEPRRFEVVIFPADLDDWLREGLPTRLPQRDLRVVHVASSGAFAVSGLAAGEYLVAAYPGEYGGSLGDDFFRRVAPFATRVTLEHGAPQTITLVPATPR
jgi:hypothetical protein